MGEKKERKNVLLTVRMTQEERNILDYLCDSLGKSISDTMSRSYKFFLNTGGASGADDEDESDERRVRKDQVVHVRIPDTDREALEGYGRRAGETVSQTIRRSIRAYGESQKGYY